MLEQLRAFGAPPEVLAAAAERQQAELDAWAVPVWPECWHAAQLFLATATQWVLVPRADGRMVRTGLRYEAITPTVADAVRQLIPRRLRQPAGHLLHQLRVMELAVLDEQARQLATT